MCGKAGLRNSGHMARLVVIASSSESMKKYVFIIQRLRGSRATAGSANPAGVCPKLPSDLLKSGRSRTGKRSFRMRIGARVSCLLSPGPARAQTASTPILRFRGVHFVTRALVT